MVRFGSKTVYPTDPEDDWGNIHMIGNAELAARLGSPIIYDRRGNVVFYDDFENDTLKWNLLNGGVPARVVHSTDRCYTGSSSLKLTTGTGGVSTGIEKEFLPAYDSRLGLACMFHPVDPKLRLTLQIYGFTGTEKYISRIRYYPDDNKLQYNSNGWIDLATDIRDGTQDENWIPIKMCLDHKTKKWIRILFGNNVYDVSDSDLEVISPDFTLPHFNVHVFTIPTIVAVAVSYLDNVIITQNEM